MISSKTRNPGFSLVELMIGIVVLGIVMIAFASIFTLFQKSSADTRQFGRTQQDARLAVDYLTEYLRQAGAKTDYEAGQRHIVHAGPYQIAINADLDDGETVSGEPPLSALSPAHTPGTVPGGGTAIYTPAKQFDSGAETIVLTLDSESDGVVDSGDQGDDVEEQGANPRLYVLKRVSYGFENADNDVRPANLAMVRGPEAYPDGSRPEPLFKYWYDDDDDPATADLLWGDLDASGTLSSGEIALVGPVNDDLLGAIQKIEITVNCESEVSNSKFERTGGFLPVTMRSEVFVRNSSRLQTTVFGFVYNDANGDGVRDPGEDGIASAEIRIGGRLALSGPFGTYNLRVPAGNYNVVETDPTGYSSTTANTVSVSLAHGEAAQVDFGDRISGSSGTIRGKVYFDASEDGKLDVGEAGIEGVVVALNTGQKTYTDVNGDYAFLVMLGTFTVTEVDPAGLVSTTANAVSVTLSSNGEVVTVNFGDAYNAGLGRIEGFVFEDDNSNGVRDMSDAGIPGVKLVLSNGDTTSSDVTGFYNFDLATGTYNITEIDPSGYTSSTPNVVNSIAIVPDTIVTINFGDVPSSYLSFDQIDAADVEPGVAVEVADFKEDGNRDSDIVLGTPFSSGIGNLLVFHNEWVNIATPSTALFKNIPSFRRDAGSSVNVVAVRDLEPDLDTDVLSGLDAAAGSNVQVWNNDGAGQISNAPDGVYVTGFSTVVLDARLADFNDDGRVDLVLGVKTSSGTYLGGLRTFVGMGGGVFGGGQFLAAVDSATVTLLGEVKAVDTGDIDGDGDLDIVAGSQNATWGGHIDIFENQGVNSGVFQWHSRYAATGAVNDLKLADMAEDANRDVDIIAAVANGPVSGGAVLFLNRGNGAFGSPAGAGSTFGPFETKNWPSDFWDGSGEGLALETGNFDGNVFPDVVLGLRTTGFYSGALYVLSTDGDLNHEVVALNSGLMGEFLSVAKGDLNKDGKMDVVAGTVTSSNSGKLLIFINQASPLP